MLFILQTSAIRQTSYIKYFNKSLTFVSSVYTPLAKFVLWKSTKISEKYP